MALRIVAWGGSGSFCSLRRRAWRQGEDSTHLAAGMLANSMLAKQTAMVTGERHPPLLRAPSSLGEVQIPEDSW